MQGGTNQSGNVFGQTSVSGQNIQGNLHAGRDLSIIHNDFRGMLLWYLIDFEDRSNLI